MLGLARLSIYLTKSIHWIFTCAWHWWDGGLWSTQSNVLGSVLRVFKNPWPSCGDWSTLPSYHYSCDIQAKEKSGKGHLKCTCLCDTLRIDWARSPRETRCLRLRAVVKPLNVCWAHITLNPLQTVSTQWWRVMSPTSNVKVQMKSKTRVHKIWGCFWHFHKRQDFNMLCLLISYISNFTKCFCRTAWSCSSGSWWGIKWGLGGKPSEVPCYQGCGFCFPTQLKVLWNSAELWLSTEVRGPCIHCLVMARPTQIKRKASEREPWALAQDWKKI